MAAPNTRHYRSVHVALIRWNDDPSARVWPEFEILRLALMEFHFQIFDIRIQKPTASNTISAQESLQEGLIRFYNRLANKPTPSLAMLICNGRGGGTGAPGQLMWFSRDGVQINWTHLQNTLVQVQQVDTLLMLDCDEAATAFPPLGTTTGTNYELDIIAAAGPLTKATAGQYSFTKTLTRTLGELEGTEFTLTQLWLRLEAEGLNRIQHRAYYFQQQVLCYINRGANIHQARAYAISDEQVTGELAAFQRRLVPGVGGSRLPEMRKILRGL